MAHIEFNHVIKEYPAGDSTIRALDDADFHIEEGRLAIVLGQSGAGKTTALNILGGMDTATQGSVLVNGRDITRLSHKELVMYRRTNIGFVFQFYNLIPSLTALENVELASQISDDHLDPAQTLGKVGLGKRLNNFSSQLSGGEQQRVSIARAIAKKPKLLLCDEPTGALDYATGKQILQLLQDVNRNEGITVIIITHNNAIAPMADQVIHFRSGKVMGSTLTPHRRPSPTSSGKGARNHAVRRICQGRLAHLAGQFETVRTDSDHHHARRRGADGHLRRVP